MAKRQVEIIILCEGKQDELFVQYFLLKWGFKLRNIRFVTCLPGKESGEAFVRRNYAIEVNAYRDRKTKGLIAITDADKKSVKQKLTQLREELSKNHISEPKQYEAIAVFIPKRNIETWLHYLKGEQVNEEDKYSKKNPSQCKLYVEDLADRCQQKQKLEENAPPSLKRACQEFQRLLPLLN